MNIAHFFIRRPIFAAVISIITVLLGALAYFTLPVSQYPDIAPPTIVVTATYPGATAETVAATVAAPIEQEINGVEDMLYMSSVSSNDGSLRITVSFKLGTDLDQAQVLTQNRVRIAEARLPEEVRRIGVVTQKNSPELLVVNFLYSPDDSRDQLYLSNYALLQLRDELARIDGVGAIMLFGVREFSMRIWLDPDRLQSLGLTAGDVVSALQQQNIQVAAGILAQPPVPTGRETQLIVNTQGRFDTPEEFEEAIVFSSNDGRLVRVRDVARVELGATSYVTNSYWNGYPAIAIVANQRPGANALETANNIIKTFDELSANFPSGVAHEVVYNPTTFIDDSFHAVQHTILEAVILVALVVIVFLQNFRAALIPLLTIPVSIVGTFAIMAAFGFSLNNLSLFGLVLAIGIVVDDAIVVVENVERHMEHGLSPKEAAFKAMDEVTGPVIAIGVVLSAVFIPTAFVPGISGQFYRQFALTIAGATLISVFNSLTLTPAACAVFLKPRHAKRGPIARVSDFLLGWFFKLFNKTFNASANAYAWVLPRIIRVAVLVLILYAGMLVATGGLFQKIPRGFIPVTDQGYMIVAIQLPDGASLERTDAVTLQVQNILDEIPGVGSSVAFAGVSGATQTNATNSGVIYCPLDPFPERIKNPGQDLYSIIAEANRRIAGIQDASIFVIPPPAVRGIGTLGGFSFMIQDRSGAGSAVLAETTNNVVTQAWTDERLTGVFTQFRANSPQLYADIDRTRAEMLSVPVRDALDALQINIGSSYINDFNAFGRSFRVTAAADAEHRMEPEDIAKLRARSTTGAMVPLGSFTTFRNITGPENVIRYNLYPAAEIVGDVADGYSTGQAIEAMEAAANEALPAGFGFSWTGLYLQQILSGNTAQFIFPLCVLFVFLSLAALYESWSLPFVIILIVPMCVLSALLGVLTRGMDNNILTQVGLVVLVGLACKNAILIVEFAKELEEQGHDRVAAAVEAGRLRLRPILMTSFAFILGTLPLVLAEGAGAELRQSLGTAVFAGMIGVTIFGLIFTPVFYVIVRTITGFFSRKPRHDNHTPHAPTNPTAPILAADTNGAAHA